MKTNIYKTTVVILVLCLGFVVYLLNSDESTSNTPQKMAQENIDSKATDLKDIKNQKESQKETNITKYSPQSVDRKEVDAKLGDLNIELAKTQEMLKEFDKNNPNKQVKMTNAVTTQEIAKLQAQINEVKSTINKISSK